MCDTIRTYRKIGAVWAESDSNIAYSDCFVNAVGALFNKMYKFKVTRVGNKREYTASITINDRTLVLTASSPYAAITSIVMQYQTLFDIKFKRED